MERLCVIGRCMGLSPQFLLEPTTQVAANQFGQLTYVRLELGAKARTQLVRDGPQVGRDEFFSDHERHL